VLYLLETTLMWVEDAICFYVVIDSVTHGSVKDCTEYWGNRQTFNWLRLEFPLFTRVSMIVFHTTWSLLYCNT